MASLVGALGVGSVLGHWLAGSKDRRSSRATVLRAIGRVESSRWAPSADRQTFLTAARELSSAALLAGIPRSVVVEDLLLAQAASWLKEASCDENPNEDAGGGGISSEFASAVRDAQAVLGWVTAGVALRSVSGPPVWYLVSVDGEVRTEYSVDGSLTGWLDKDQLATISMSLEN